MNLQVIKEQLLKMGEPIGLKVNEETAEMISVDSQITAKDYFKSAVYLRVVVYSSGTLHMFLTFNQIEKTSDNLFLINNFNAENPWFKAYIANIGNKDYLELHYATFALTDDGQPADVVNYLLNQLLTEDILKNLNPILNACK
ncbi:MAG: hypothetical protein MJ216_01660 [Bacilli bacterium]|nr:hypothetical protein [Bacilli bacterium]